MTPIRVVFLNGSGLPGGGEIALAQLASGVDDGEIVLFEHGPAERLFRNKGIAVQVRTISPKLLANSKESGIPGPGAVVSALSHSLRLASFLRKFDVVHCNNQKAWVMGAFASALARRPVVWHLHDILSREHFSRAKIRLVVALARWRRAKVVANSIASAEAFILAGGRRSQVEVLYNPVDPAPFREATPLPGLRSELGCEGEPLWGLFSRLASWKGQHIAIQALSRLPRGHLVLVGSALFGEEPWEAHLRELVQALGVGDRVHFLGFRKDVPELLATVDGAIHASTAAEPFGLVILEAQLAGKPVVATAAGGATEIVTHGRNGWLVPPGDADALAGVLAAWIADPDAAAATGRVAAADAAEKFDLERLSSRFREILREAARR
jgi:glycosyltransferase involved in cell wall biosynthesis